MKNRKKQAQIIRVFRKIHKTTGIYLFVFFFFISISGLLLGWKKNSGGIILPETEKGISTNLKEWLPLDVLQAIAFKTINEAAGSEKAVHLNRIDARPEKGMVKFIFDYKFWEVQLDGATGKVLATTIRRSDLLEDIHDGSILDDYFGTKGEIIKLIYTTITGLALLVFTITGFWLWFGPKRMKKRENYNN